MTMMMIFASFSKGLIRLRKTGTYGDNNSKVPHEMFLDTLAILRLFFLLFFFFFNYWVLKAVSTCSQRCHICAQNKK